MNNPVTLLVHYGTNATEIEISNEATYAKLSQIIADHRMLQVPPILKIILYLDPRPNNNDAIRVPVEQLQTISLPDRSHIYVEVEDQQHQQQHTSNQGQEFHFWKHLANAKLDTTTNILSLQDGCVFPTRELSSLYIRESYVELYDIISAFEKPANLYLVKGNPGIGKSMFFYYYLWRKVQNLETCPKNIVFDFVHHNAILFTFKDNLPTVYVGNRDQFANFLLYPDTFYFVDGITPLPSKCFVLFASSPDRTIYEKYMKEKFSASVILPIWTYYEIKGSIPIYCKDDDNNRESFINETLIRFRRWGGVPRYVFEKISPSEQNTLLLAISRCGAACLRSVNQQELEEPGSHKVMHLDVVPNTDYVQQRMVIGSPFIKQKLFQRFYWRWTNDLLDQMKTSSFLSSSFGSAMFEQLSHQTLTVGGTFFSTNLYTLKLEPSTQKEFFDYNILEYDENVYLRPNNRDFEAVDSIIKPKFLFQMTVSDSHSIKSSGLHNLLHSLDPSHTKDIFLFFVVQEKNYSTFSQQSYVKTETKNKKTIKSRDDDIERVHQFALQMTFNSVVSPETLCPIVDEDDKIIVHDE
ncbi:hypothetical protein DFA_01648 [Cavenderia fasciculata]|uniref:Crinkler family protein n=1 Tax=Cavenderia fasciculata TaxID=261658 RepID=F4PTZ4_CACFS|nr:uncharacterized protein DFA_01648 [Cavenderia fasciculata]EGG21762.1 hypothetical protein DFA_01648 [Cavenderia fasciculata]|eukprot:XP_004359612.1 hypothetical protein DFA_01648 [Cavenderia fasciculata]